MRIALFLLAGSVAAAAGQRPQWLAGLTTTGPKGMCVARERFAKQFAAGTPAQDRALFELWDFYDDSVSDNQDRAQHIWTGDGDDYFNGFLPALRIQGRQQRSAALARFPAANARIREWERCGYVVAPMWDESVGFDRDPLFLRAMADKLRPEIQAYIELFLKQSPYSLDYDGALALPFDRLRSRIRRWENFRDEHRDIAPLVAHIERPIHAMFQIYLCGMDNTPLWPGQLPEFARESYEQFLRINTASREYGLMRDAVALLTKREWQWSGELGRLYESRRYVCEAAAEPSGPAAH